MKETIYYNKFLLNSDIKINDKTYTKGTYIMYYYDNTRYIKYISENESIEDILNDTFKCFLRKKLTDIKCNCLNLDKMDDEFFKIDNIYLFKFENCVFSLMPKYINDISGYILNDNVVKKICVSINSIKKNIEWFKIEQYKKNDTIYNTSLFNLCNILNFYSIIDHRSNSIDIEY